METVEKVGKTRGMISANPRPCINHKIMRMIRIAIQVWFIAIHLANSCVLWRNEYILRRDSVTVWYLDIMYGLINMFISRVILIISLFTV